MENDKKLLLLIKALLNGLRYRCKNGMIVGMDDDYRPYIVCQRNGSEYLMSAQFEFDLSWLAKEATYMTDEQEVSIIFSLSNMREEDRVC